jgi:hypothetical protein
MIFRDNGKAFGLPLPKALLSATTRRGRRRTRMCLALSKRRHRMNLADKDHTRKDIRI